MQENELEYYSKVANWDFSQIKCETEKLTEWDYFEEIQKYTNEKSHKMQLKFGYKDEGIKRKKFISRATGQIEDEYITGLLKEEWIKEEEDKNEIL